MEQLYNGFTLEIPEGTFPLGTDSMLLADFARLPKQASVLDLGSGCGTLGTLLCAKDSRCHVTGIELDDRAHQAALDNISRNGLEDRLSSICADLRTIPTRFPSGSFHCCISNPPYFSGGPESKKVPNARRENSCNISELIQSAAWALRYGGDFFLVHRPERLAEIISCAARNHLEAKRLRLIRHCEEGSVSLILLSFRKGAKPGLIWEELSLFHRDGTPTPEYRALYHF